MCCAPEARTETDRMCTDAPCNRGDILIVHGLISSYRTPLSQLTRNVNAIMTPKRWVTTDPKGAKNKQINNTVMVFGEGQTGNCTEMTVSLPAHSVGLCG